MTSFGELTGAKLYFDSNVFIYALESPDRDLRKRHQHLFHMLAAKRFDVCTSLVTRAEVLVRPLRMNQVELADRYRALLSGADAVSVVGLNIDVMDRAAGLRADYPALKLPDALHIATAMHVGCDALVSNDLRLRVVANRIPILLPEDWPRD